MNQRPARTRGRAVKRHAPLGWIIGAGIGAMILIGLIVLVMSSRAAGGSGTVGDVAVPENIDGVTSFTDLLQGHKEGTLSYPQRPPVGGEHNAAWQNCGSYDTPVRSEHAVHALEHGAVWITYEPTLPADQVAALRQAARGRTHVLVTPFAALPSPIVVSAWGFQLALESPADPRLAQFIAKYEQGPQTLEPGASCSGSIGLPVER